MRKPVPEVSSTAQGRRLRAILKTKSTIFPITADQGQQVTYLCFLYSVTLKATLVLNFKFSRSVQIWRVSASAISGTNCALFAEFGGLILTVPPCREILRLIRCWVLAKDVTVM